MSGLGLGLLLLRVATGSICIAHGLPGLRNPARTYALVDRLGMRPRTLWAVAAWVTEVPAGVLVVLGLVLPVGAALAVGSMSLAALTKRANGFWTFRNGYEYPLVLTVTAAGLACTGAGPYSLDTVLGLAPLLARPGLALLLVLLAAGGAVAGWATRGVRNPPPGSH